MTTNQLDGIEPKHARVSAVRLLQITDTHLFADPDGRLLGLRTRPTFESVLTRALAAHPETDRLMLTGDLGQDESPAAYRFLRQRLLTVGIPSTCIPGNHDTPELMQELVVPGRIDIDPSVQIGAWNLVLLDSTVPMQPGGHLDADQLEHLDATLARHPERHALVCLHHQPLPIGSRWMDTMALDNGDAFFAVIDRHPQVRCILWGHVHQEFNARRKGVHLLASPSTCVQFTPGSDGFSLDSATPGYRWLDLHENGEIATGVERIDAYPDALDFTQVNGY